MKKQSRKVMFGTAARAQAGVPQGKDNWQTPGLLFQREHARYSFTVDAAADATNHLLPRWFGPGSPLGEDSLQVSWVGEVCWLNPPYSLVAKFVEKAAQERERGATTVMLIPSRTDTRWWHKHVWDEVNETWRPGVRGRFVKGRVKFVNPDGGLREGHTPNSAPFPSVLLEFDGKFSSQETLF